MRLSSHTSGLGIDPPAINIIPNMITPNPMNIHLKFSRPNKSGVLATAFAPDLRLDTVGLILTLVLLETSFLTLPTTFFFLLFDGVLTGRLTD